MVVFLDVAQAFFISGHMLSMSRIVRPTCPTCGEKTIPIAMYRAPWSADTYNSGRVVTGRGLCGLGRGELWGGWRPRVGCVGKDGLCWSCTGRVDVPTYPVLDGHCQFPNQDGRSNLLILKNVVHASYLRSWCWAGMLPGGRNLEFGVGPRRRWGRWPGRGVGY